MFWTDDRRIGVAGAFLVFLTSLFFLTLSDLMQKKRDVSVEAQEEGLLLSRWIKDEYKKTYALKKKNELLAKAGCVEHHTEQSILIEEQNNLKICPHANLAEKIHFKYLEKYSNSSTKEAME